MKQLEIHVVTYKRPAVIAYTLDSIFDHITEPQYFDKVNLRVAFNECSEEDLQVIEHASERQKVCPHINEFTFLTYKKNMGKAYALNNLFAQYCDPDTTTVTMDGDMVFTDHYMDVFETTAEHLKFDLVGFASNQYWGHYPLKEETLGRDWRDYKVWYTMSIAGGIMMGKYDFLSQFEWTNVDGIYGGDDFNMSFNTDLKFIVEDERDWLVHDPLGPSRPELSRYYAAKNFYRQQGLFIYPHGWYENANVDNK